MAGMKLKIAGEQHEKFRLESLEFLRKWAGELPAIEMLAIGSYMIGQLIALQDQRKYTSAAVMDIVRSNIEEGNKEVIRSMMNTKGSG